MLLVLLAGCQDSRWQQIPDGDVFWCTDSYCTRNDLSDSKTLHRSDRAVCLVFDKSEQRPDEGYSCHVTRDKCDLMRQWIDQRGYNPTECKVVR